MKTKITLVLALFFSLYSFGQSGTVDTAFNAVGAGFGLGDGADNTIYAMAVQADGKTLIGGDFQSYNGTVRNRIARLNADGTLDNTFNVQIGGTRVSAIVLQPDGKIIIGGFFSSFNGTSRNNIARLNANGSLDTTFTPGTGLDNGVLTIALQSDGKILLGGQFTSFNGTSRNFLARLNTNGSLDTSFIQGTAVNATITTIKIQTDGKILIGGGFTSYQGIARNRLARLNIDGSIDNSFSSNAGASGVVRTIFLQTNGKILIGGDFQSYNGTARNCIARVNSDGNLDTTFDPGIGADNIVYGISSQIDGKILLAGVFRSYNGTTRNQIARVNSDGTLDSSFNPVLGGGNSTILTLALQTDEKILVGGSMSDDFGTTYYFNTRLTNDGAKDTSYNTGKGLGSGVGDIAVQSDGKILVGGNFTTYNGLTRKRIARLNANGSLDTSFNSIIGANDSVRTIALQSNGKIIIGGNFSVYNGVQRNFIARLNSDGSLDTGFNLGSGTTGGVHSILIQNDGKIIICGNFDAYNGTPRKGIARLNSNGTLDVGFNSDNGLNGTVTSAFIQSDGKVIIGGGFTSVKGTNRNRIARLNTDGTLDTSFNPGIGTTGGSGWVMTICLQPDGKIIIGGDFTFFNITPSNRIARLNNDGTFDSSFNIGTGANNQVESIILQNDNKIIVGGLFTSFNNVSQSKITRLNADGSIDTSFSIGSGANTSSIISAITLQLDAKILIGGSFTDFNGINKDHIIRIIGGEIITAPSSTAQTFCSPATVASLIATGQNLKWYTTATGGITLPITAVLNTGTYFASQTISGVESPRTSVAVTINSTLAPTVSTQTFNSGATVANLVATGTALKWYTLVTGGTSLSAAAALATGTYYVSQTLNGCESTRTAVIVTVTSLYTAIPDANFEQALFDQGIDVVNGDNRVLTSAIVGLSYLDVMDANIEDLTGIEGFANLQFLNCMVNNIINLNINGLTNLNTLFCDQNQLGELNVSGLTNLQQLSCGNNFLSELNLSGLTNLLYLKCSNNFLTNLNVSGQTSLQNLRCGLNQLTELNLNGLTSLIDLSCDDNLLTTLDVSRQTKLQFLFCSNNELINLNASSLTSLEILNCANNQLTTLNVSGTTNLNEFNCSFNNLSSLDLRGIVSNNNYFNFVTAINPLLRCISIDNVANVSSNFNKDATTSFSANCNLSIVNYCRGDIASPLTTTAAPGSILKWYTVATRGTASLVAPTPLTTIVGTKLYYVSQTVGGIESARVTVTVNTIALPATPGTITGTAAQGALVGTNTTATYTIAEVVNATSYTWTAPTGVNIVSGQGTNTVTVNFANVPAGAGAIGNLSVVAVNNNDCNSLVRNLALTKALPAAPSAIRMTDATLAVPVSGIPTAVTSFAAYMGTARTVTLTATPVVGATSYLWELPTGVNVLSIATTTAGVTSGSNVITVNFEGVTSADTYSYTTIAGVLTHVLRIGVKAVTGTGASITNNSAVIEPATSSTARLLTLRAVRPAAPSRIVMTNDAVSTTAITAVSRFVGTTTILTLTATPSVLASSYTWELPNGVNQLSGGNTNVITVNFAGVAPAITSLYIGVKAVNGIDESVTSTNGTLVPATSSTARLLRASAAIPAAVSIVTGQFAGVCGGSSYNYTITPSILATSYVVTAPAGSVVTSESNLTNTAATLTTTDLTFTVVYPAGFVATVAAPKTLAVAARNGVGTSANKSYALSTLMPALGVVADGTTFQRTTPQVFSIPAVVGATSYNWVAANGATIASGQGTNSVTIDFSAVATTVLSTRLTVAAVNACGISSAIKTVTLARASTPTVRLRQETITVNATEIYPNPTSDSFSIDISTSSAGVLTMTIYSLNGAIVTNPRTLKLHEGNNAVTENISSLARGVYLVHLTNSSSNEVIIKKLIKE